MKGKEIAGRRRSLAFVIAGFTTGLGLGLVGIVLVLPPLALSHHQAGAIETSIGNAVVKLVIRVQAADLGPNPINPNAQTLQAARGAYTGSCSQCHGAAGDGRGVFGQIAFPPATDLTGPSAAEMSDAQVFYIVKNGLGFTPMPAYGGQYSDQQIWGMVAFIRSLQTGQEPHLVTLAPSSQELRAANLQAGGNARRGAELFAAQGCGACHAPAGSLSIDPTNRQVENAARSGRPGMPCYGSAAIQEDELRDLLAFVATFPQGELGPEPPGQPPINRVAIGSPCIG